MNADGTSNVDIDGTRTRRCLQATSPGVAIACLIAVVGCSTTQRDESAGILRYNADGSAVLETLPKATNPHRAHEWRRLSWQDENGRIPENALFNALRQWQANLEAWRGEAGLPDGLEAPSAAGWIERGPINVGGRTRALAIDPRDPAHQWAGAVSGGLWETFDRGETWTIVDDWWTSLAIGCIEFDPANPDVIYVGTGEGYFNGDAIGGAGVWKSTDNGHTWTHLSSTAAWNNVCRLAISPDDSQRIIAGTRNGGLHLSTDGGETWKRRYVATGSFDVDFHPTDGQQAIAHAMVYSHAQGDYVHRVLYSTDGGWAWSIADGLNEMVGFNSRIEIAYAPSDPSIVYASCAADGGKIWKSTDGGQSFSMVTQSGASSCSWYANPLWVDPTNPDFLLTGGYHIFKSTDGGVTLEQISEGYILTEQAHPDIHSFTHDPGFNGTTNRRVYVTTDGGMSAADDIYSASRSSGWYKREQGYVTTQYYGAVGNSLAGLIVGGLQDNGTLRLRDGSDLAHLTFGGDGGFCAIDWQDPDYVYGEYISLMIHRSANGGQSAGYIYQGLRDAGSDANFIAPFILDPNEPSRLWAGGRSVWRTDNAKANQVQWLEVSNPNTDRVSALAVAPGNSDLVWYGLNNGEIHRATNGTDASPAWAAIDDNAGTNPLPNRYITRIVVDPDNHDVVYVALGGFSPDNLYRTTDGGQTWSDVTGEAPFELPNAPIRGVARHPRDANRLYVGTEVGVFESLDGGTSWSTSEFGPAAVSVDELNFMHGSSTLLAATHGRGIFTRNVALTCLELDMDPLIAGEFASLQLTGGVPGSAAVVLWATRTGTLEIDRVQQWCATFGLDIPPGQALNHVLLNGVFEESGAIAKSFYVPGNAAGLSVHFQAAMRGTCPDECVSNIVDRIVTN